MSRIALITDTHFGARGDSVVFLKYFNKFYNDFFFPYLEKNGITSIYHLGDIVERRKFINFYTSNQLRKFVTKCTDNGIDLNIVIGNHDCFYKNTNEINAVDELFSDSKLNVRYWSKPTEIDIDGLKVAILPWICSDNYQESMDLIKNTKAQVAFGHLEIAGFSMYKGDNNVDRGSDRKIFDKFDMVLTGHFHHKSSDGQIFYLGSPYEITWADWNDDRGFHIFDTDTRELTYVKNPFHIFHKLIYNNGCDVDLTELKDCYVKVIVQSKDDDSSFDRFIEQLESSNPVDLQVIEDTVNIEADGNEYNPEVDDTLTLLKREIEGLEVNIDKKKLDSHLTNLYIEAMQVE